MGSMNLYKAACMPHNMHGTIAITKIIGKPVKETRRKARSKADRNEREWVDVMTAIFRDASLIYEL